ncbi:GNAT family N-acetyltransferase [Arthrobacter sp. H14]|uniref:GNAT family N-acetyltransferase n=1 Tax=Arthrobacter sp. H14 TaxID=1312959 RepID=UPI00047E50EC|nr:GNAT family N-acetyltransferase [Arthrobacter sp. H14]
MPDTFEEPTQAAELAVFERKSLSLDAAAAAGLPGRFESFCMGGLRASMTTADQYGFLNAIEGVTDQSVEFLPDVLRRFPDPRQPAIVATFPSLELIDWLLDEGYEPAPARPITYLRPGHDFSMAKMSAERWQIREVSTKGETMAFLDLLEAGYAETSDVGALIRAEHALPIIRGFIASRNDQPLAAAAMSLHATGAVIGGACTLPTARGTGAQRALLAHRLQLVETLGMPLAAATAASGTPSIRTLTKLGFTIVERTAWRFNR